MEGASRCAFHLSAVGQSRLVTGQNPALSGASPSTVLIADRIPKKYLHLGTFHGTAPHYQLKAASKKHFAL
jgi:hypothetical protein